MVALADVRSPMLRQLAVAGMVGAVTQLVLSSFASLVIGDQAARVGRYQYLVLVLLAAAVALSLEAVTRVAVAQPWGRRLVPVAAVVVLAVAIGHGVTLERRQAASGRPAPGCTGPGCTAEWRLPTRASGSWSRTPPSASTAASSSCSRNLSSGASSHTVRSRRRPVSTPSRSSSLRPGPRTRPFTPTRITRVQGLTGPRGRRPGCYSFTSDGTTQPIVDVWTGGGTRSGSPAAAPRCRRSSCERCRVGAPHLGSASGPRLRRHHRQSRDFAGLDERRR